MGLRLRKQHSLGDFLNDTFSLVPLIWKRALPVSLAAIVPGIAVWMLAMGSIASWVKGIAAEPASIENDPVRIFSGLMPMLLLGALATVLLFLGQAFQKAFVCAQVGGAIDGRRPRLSELLAAALHPAWIRVAVQDAVIGSLAGSVAFAVIAAAIFPFLFSVLNDVVRLKGPGGPGLRFVFEIVALYLGSIVVALAAVWWLRVKTCVSAPAAVLERVNSFSGIGRSLELVRGRGWRTFGIMFIVSLVISFGLGILTGPFTFAVAMPGYFTFLRSSTSGEKPSPEAIAALISSMTWGAGLVMLLSGLVKGTLWPSFLALLHADLRIRAGEIEAEPEVEDETAGGTRSALSETESAPPEQEDDVRGDSQGAPPQTEDPASDGGRG